MKKTDYIKMMYEDIANNPNEKDYLEQIVKDMEIALENVTDIDDELASKINPSLINKEASAICRKTAVNKCACFTNSDMQKLICKLLKVENAKSIKIIDLSAFF